MRCPLCRSRHARQRQPCCLACRARSKLGCFRSVTATASAPYARAASSVTSPAGQGPGRQVCAGRATLPRSALATGACNRCFRVEMRVLPDQQQLARAAAAHTPTPCCSAALLRWHPVRQLACHLPMGPAPMMATFCPGATPARRQAWMPTARGSRSWEQRQRRQVGTAVGPRQAKPWAAAGRLELQIGCCPAPPGPWPAAKCRLLHSADCSRLQVPRCLAAASPCT